MELCLPPERWLAPPRRVSQVPRLICPRVLSPSTPESPAVAFRPFLDGECQASSSSGDWPPSLRANGAVSGSLALRLAGSPPRASAVDSHSRLVGYLSNEPLQGKLLSAYKISQACPGAPSPALRLLATSLRCYARRLPWARI